MVKDCVSYNSSLINVSSFVSTQTSFKTIVELRSAAFDSKEGRSAAELLIFFDPVAHLTSIS
jgi:hypothetical protein